MDAHHQIGIELEGCNTPIVDQNLDGGVVCRADRMISKGDQKCLVSGLLTAFKVIQQIAMLRPSRFQNLIDLNVERVLKLVRHIIGHDASVDVADTCGTSNIRSALLAFSGLNETGLPVAGGGQEEVLQRGWATIVMTIRLQVSAPLDRLVLEGVSTV